MIRLLKSEMPRITIKLSYIDIAQYYLREYVQNNIILSRKWAHLAHTLVYSIALTL